MSQLLQKKGQPDQSGMFGSILDLGDTYDISVIPNPFNSLKPRADTETERLRKEACAAK